MIATLNIMVQIASILTLEETRIRAYVASSDARASLIEYAPVVSIGRDAQQDTDDREDRDETGPG